jgi:hypothetical protein
MNEDWGSLFLVVDDDHDGHYNGDDDDEDDADEEAPPLLAARGAGACDGTADLVVGLDDVLVDLLALCFDVLHERFLLRDDLVEVREELGKFLHLLRNLLNGLVSILYVTESRL